PTLGIVRVDGDRSFVIADLPGLIPGAAEGKGLGHQFLRHTERTRLLLHMLDLDPQAGRDPIDDLNVINRELAAYSAALATRPQIDLDPQAGRDPIDDLNVINRELAAYSAALATRPQIIVANKADLPDAAPNREQVDRFCASKGLTLFVISAVTGAGLTDLVRAVVRHLDSISASASPDASGTATDEERLTPRSAPSPTPRPRSE